MECCDSVSDDGASGPCINQPPGNCSPPSSMLLLLQRENPSHLNTASPPNQGEAEWRTDVTGQSKGERRAFGDGHEGEEGIDKKQVDDCAVGDFLEKGEAIREEHDEGGDEADEIECQIIYQADGSAYILESQSQLPYNVVPCSSRPPFVNTCHFSSSQSSTLKSFHVFHPKNWCHLTGDILALLACQSKDRAPARTGSSEAELAPLGKEQPVLVCFLCHLSFSQMQSFRGHVSQYHNIMLTTEEQQLLSLQHTCAILQSVGPSNHPLLSFLEPKTSNVPTQLATTALGHNTMAMLSQENREPLQISEPGLPLQPSLPRVPLPTSVLSPAKDPSTLGREGPQRSSDDGGGSREREERLCSGVVSTAEDCASSISSSGRQEYVTEPALSNQSNPKSPNSVTVATSFMSNTKSLTDSELECGTSFNCHGPGPVSSTVQTSPMATTPKEFSSQESVMEIEPNNLSEKGSAMAKEPNGKLCNDSTADVTNSDLPSNHSSSQSRTVTPPLTQTTKSQLEDGLVDSESRGTLLAGSEGDFVVGQDTVQGSSYSFGGQINTTHSRNSCKTLKCPKCNWHYKYQQTLEAHMKEKHPDSDDGQCPYCVSGQNHPRLARGETYTCGYKPFRCQVCQYSTTTKGNLSIHMQSDKHLNNMQNLQSQTRPDAPKVQPNALSNTHSIPPSPSPSKVQGRASWRCEVCDYETNVARNLRIHMTSEKHTHNMLLLQQNLAHMQRQHRQNAAELYPYCQPQTRFPDPTSVIQPETLQESPRKSVDETPPEALFECALCGHFSSDSLVALSQHLAVQRSLPDADWRGSTGDAHLCRLCHYATPLRANFQLHCQTDKHLQRYQLAAHLQEASRHHRNPEEEEEWMLRCVAAGVQVQLRCNACSYEANSLEKLKLHTMNSRHKASLRLYKYLQQFEGAVSDGGSLCCVLCDYSTQNSLSLVQHANSLSHQKGEGLLRLQRIQNGLQDEEEELGAMFEIRKNHAKDNGDVNETESPAEITSNQEDQTKHASTEEEKTEAPMHGDKKQNEPPKRSASGDTDDSIPAKRPRAQDETSSASEQVRQCPFCRFCHTDLGRLRSHVMIQHAVQPTLCCPLCQDTLRSVALMRSHLTHLHSVTADCTQKLINAVIASDVLPEKMFLPVPNSNTQQTKADSSCNGIKRPEEQGEDEEERVITCRPETAKTQKQPLEDAEATKENNAAFPCWQKGCNKVLTSSSALQTHVNHFHSQRLQMPISDRHVYKYRCSQCSLAFKTAEKLQQHSQYHAIRAATMCCLCQRSFRTIQALQKHLETSHLELSEIQLQQLCGSLLMTEDLLASEDQGLDEEQGTFEEEKVKEDEESDLEEKISPSHSVLSFAREDTELNPKPSVVPLRKGPNLSTEKFLDPSRPFKCTVCKESFTQKNILLVHYNSVSHLHKVKRSVQDSSAALPESVSSSADHKPFKCSICSVAYSQSSTLEIHMRSVLHQTKARAAKLDSSAASSTSVNPSLHKVVSDNATASSPTVLKPTNAMNSVSCTTSALDQGQLKHQLSNEHNVVSSSQAISISSLSEESKKKPMVDVMSTTNQHKLLQQQQLQQHQLVQAQAQIQQELQKKAALLQSHLFNPALLHHFPITTDTLLPLQQQQQLLLPFLIPGGEFQISPELNLKGSELNLSKAKPGAPENCAEPSQQDSLISSCKQPLNGVAASTSHPSVSLTPEDSGPVHQQADEQILASDSQIHKGMDEGGNKDTKELCKPTSHNNNGDFKAQDEVEDELEDEDSGEFFTHLIPPRVAHDAPGNVSKALLENIGFELVMQFNENKQQYQRTQTEVVPNGQTKFNTKEVHHADSVGKLECESCGKLFSNALILKSHKEHVHKYILPIQSLEKFAKDYREQYDKIFPFTPSTPDTSASLPSPASPPLPPADPTQKKAVSCIPAPTTTVTPPSVSTPQVPLATIPLPIDLPLFPPLLMHSIPLPGLPPQLPVHLPPVEAGLTSDLAQLYQQQLTPSMLQQQGKRPRTRITDDQLKILRQYFDINNSPNDDQIQDMANKSGLPNKVIKHWFRNTLFKERQRNKDSPYNFNNPPITTLEEVKVDSRPSSPELPRQELSGGKRSSRTRFTDYQLRVLQDFFDANAYPKDDEFEQLSNLLNLATRVIVVWFQNARQKARKSFENQGEGGKEIELRELSNDRYIRTANSSYECKKCNMVFQRIFDLISHQKKVCYKDDDDVSCNPELLLDLKSHSPKPDTSSLNLPPSSSSLSNCTELSTDGNSTDKEQSDPDTVSDSLTEDLKPITEASEHCLENSKLEATYKQTKHPNDENIQSCSKIQSPSPLHQQQQTNPSITQTSPVPSQNSQMSSASPSAQQQHPNQAQQMTPYHCIQCKLSFPSFEHWQEHQQMHFLVAQNHFVPPQFLDRTMDIPLMLFDSTNPLMARQVLSGAFPQIALSSSTAIPDSTVNSLKRRLEPKSGTSAVENDWEHSGDDSQRDKRMRTTITPEQLEILYQKYLLDSNPTRQMLDNISQEVGLKKRVVQVWFQNTRARERKGQFRGLGPAQAHRRCPFCRALFKAQTALDAHIRSRHWHEAKNAGFSMAVAGMTQEQEGSQMKMDLFNFSNSLQMPNTGEGLNGPDSLTCKSMDLSTHDQDPSPKPLISGRASGLEGSSTSVQQFFECGNLDNHKGTSVNPVPNGTITDEENYSEGKQNSTDHLSCSSEREASSENEDKMSSGLVSPAMSFNAKDYDNDLVLDYSENSSLADPASPCPGGSNSQSIDNDRLGQKRYRTQLSNLQVKVLKACFSDYKTPTMLECEALGNDMGLPKRVVQVWFQNARAKEKKAKLSLAKQFGTGSTCTERPKTECTLCCVKYSGCLSVRDHVFSQQHLAKVKEALGGQIDREREFVDFASVRHLMTEQEMNNLKKANGIMAVVQTQSAESSTASSHTTPNLLTTGLPGTGSKSLASSSSTKSDPVDPPSDGLISKPSTSSSSMSAAIGQTSVNANNSVSPPKPVESELQLQLSKESNSENGRNPSERLEKASPDSATHSNSSVSKKKQDSLTPAASTPKPVKDYNIDLGQLQALQAAGNLDQSPLLSNPLLPCLMPGFPPMFSPQIPTALTGNFLQPMFGMDGMFQYSPVLPQALMGLSPGSILQQYQHNLQGALMHHRLQLQKKQLLQESQKPKASQISASTYSQDMAYNKDLVLNLSKPEEKQTSSDGEGSASFSSGTTKPLDDSFLISQCIVSKGTSREGGKDVCLYDCLACGISLNVEELIQHLECRQHRQRAVEHLNAKEHASRLLPHVSPSSTSQPNPPSNPISPSKSLPKQSASESPSAISCLSRPTDHHSQTPSTSTALSGAAQSSCTPASPSVQVSLHSTVTSSLNGNVISLKATDSANGCYTSNGAAEEKKST